MLSVFRSRWERGGAFRSRRELFATRDKKQNSLSVDPTVILCCFLSILNGMEQSYKVYQYRYVLQQHMGGRY